MTDVSQDDLKSLQDENEELRQQILDEEQKASEAAQARAREIEYVSLSAEKARLQARLDAAKQASALASGNGPHSGPLAAAVTEYEAAERGVTTPGVPVDTNAEVEAEAKPEDAGSGEPENKPDEPEKGDEGQDDDTDEGDKPFSEFTTDQGQEG